MPTIGSRDLRRVQFGKESVHGTAVSATSWHIAKCETELELGKSRPSDMATGILAEYEYSNVVSQIMRGQIEAEATYRNLVAYLGMSVIGGITGVADTGASYRWDYTPNMGSVNNPDSYTLEYGDDVQAYRSKYVFMPSIELSGRVDQTVRVRGPLLGQNKEAASFVSLSHPTVYSPVLMNSCKFYMGATYAALGSVGAGTLMGSKLIDFNCKLVSEKGNGVDFVKHADGNNYPGERAERKRHLALSLTLGYDSEVVALWANFTGQTEVFAKLEFIGPAINGGGTNNLQIIGCFLIDKWPSLGENQNAEDTVALDLVSFYNATAARDFNIVLRNDITAVP